MKRSVPATASERRLLPQVVAGQVYTRDVLRPFGLDLSAMGLRKVAREDCTAPIDELPCRLGWAPFEMSDRWQHCDRSVVGRLLGPPDGVAKRLTLLSIFDFLITRIPDQIRTPPWKGAS